MLDRLQSTLRQLRLSGLAQTLDVRLQEAAGRQLSHAEFLKLILPDEQLVRSERQIERRVKSAQFREVKPLDEFDFAFNPSIQKKQLFELSTPAERLMWGATGGLSASAGVKPHYKRKPALADKPPVAPTALFLTRVYLAACRFVREARDVLFLGPPGTGKSFLAQAIGYQAIKQGCVVLYRSIFDVVRDFLHEEAIGDDDKLLARYLKPELVIIDDMGMKQLPRRSGEVLFEIILRRYETRRTMMTSNRPLEDWGKLVGDVPTATAILDRLLHHAEMIQITGKSYRLRHQASGANEPLDEPHEMSGKPGDASSKKKATKTTAPTAAPA